MFPKALQQRLLAFFPGALKLVSQNEFEPPIRQRLGEQASRRGVAFPGTKLGTISLQFASPDTKGPPAHYTVPVDGTRARIAHCSLPHFLPTPKTDPSRAPDSASELRPRPFHRSKRPLGGQSALVEEQVPHPWAGHIIFAAANTRKSSCLTTQIFVQPRWKTVPGREQ
jgi:hypothetical protein